MAAAARIENTEHVIGVRLFMWNEENNVPPDQGLFMFNLQDFIIQQRRLIKLEPTTKVTNFELSSLLFPLNRPHDWARKPVLETGFFGRRTAEILSREISTYVRASYRFSYSALESCFVFVVGVARITGDRSLANQGDYGSRSRVPVPLNITSYSNRNEVLRAMFGRDFSDCDGDGADDDDERPNQFGEGHEGSDTINTDADNDDADDGEEDDDEEESVVIVRVLRSWRGVATAYPTKPGLVHAKPNWNLVLLQQKGDDEDGEECAICIDEIDDGGACVETSCRHLFHLPCILRWLADNESCPLCRSCCLVFV
ncbi:hypothetical protein Nepgr_032072 [Nepenthes gracilis]|uniref:RING-type domain-containing protein n=1 Tax=Nepenthes gracilis TaxID=150966 RepID=A0AAD3TJF8_NEPGR|nr:hypothetical protein Nepgr_032072 [Nepenthes gracilis]